ncbi:hypothetical protein A5791_19820 [Mycobacterium sp. 852002-51163_SCH5372311]|uniref:hypothetical protein n=1 Tax=Mycobacterium sp. 852002-51163_SCH5372311 TaxID=1834097 RepID=UPI0008005697|nr:hypothetical protein [Mycobacterium sp. 852002-51163_SCH5372311]OBF86946.1 hypothetical protein A5791_19820 [Mycobacterium sp. 852002-51163_SCH5372311]
MRRILLCEYRDGDTQPTCDGVALLLGISVEDMLEQWDPAAGLDTMPAEWKRRGAKRALHAKNAVGSNVTSVVLAFLAVRDWPGCRIDFDEKGGKMWAVFEEPGSGG